MPVFYRVHEAAVLSYMNETDELVWDVTRTSRDLAILYAPVRTGKLKGSIRASRPARTGPYTNQAKVSAATHYALYVHDGVSGRIYPKQGKYLTVPLRMGSVSGAQIRGSGGNRRPGDGRGYFLARSVRGQAAQPFLADALRTAMARVSVGATRVT